MGRHCPAGGHGQGSVDGWKKRRPGGPPSPLYLCSLKSSPSCIPKEKEKGAEPHPPPGVAAEGPPRRSSRLPWQPEASSPSQPAACRLLPGWSRVRRVSALSPRPLPGKRSPAPSPRPLPSPPRDSGWGGGNPARQVPAAHTLPGSPRRTSGPGGCPAKAPRAGNRARRPPPPLPAGEGCPAAGTPGVGSECAPRGCAARCCPALPRGRGALGAGAPGAPGAGERRSRPGRRCGLGGRGPASAAALGLPGAAPAAGAPRGPPPSGPAAASFPRARAPGPRLSALAAPPVPPPASPASRLAGQSKNRAHSSNFCVRARPEAGQRDGHAGVAARARGPCAVARGCDLERASPVSRPTRTKAIARTLAVVTRAEE